MLIEMHLIQNHAPSNLNRDDSGSPKDCIFGGVRRSRISSQCLKRSIRRSLLFIDGLAGVPLATRTRQLPERVREFLIAAGVKEALAQVAAAKASGFGTKEGKEQESGKTAQMMFLSEEDIQAVAGIMLQAARSAKSVEAFQKLSAKDLQGQAELRGWRPITPDIALFGRMITSEAFRDVEAAVQVAHAISTHKMDHEFDYFTAVDDLQGLRPEDDEAGAGMIGDVEFNSACYYKYFTLDYDAFRANLAGPAPAKQDAKADHAYRTALAEAQRVVALAVPAFLKATVFTTPSGKQNIFAAHQLPDGVLVEVRPRKTPVSYANTFVKPCVAHEDLDLVEGSLQKFATHVEVLTRKFSLQASPRLWFTTREIKMPGVTLCPTFDDLLKGLGTSLAEAHHA